MTRTLDAQDAPDGLQTLLTKLGVAAKEASANVQIHEGDEFSSLRADVKLYNTSCGCPCI